MWRAVEANHGEVLPKKETVLAASRRLRGQPHCQPQVSARAMISIQASVCWWAVRWTTEEEIS